MSMFFEDEILAFCTIANPDKITHRQLCLAGKEWLKAKGCNPIFVERSVACNGENPDVIGWQGRECFIIECKTSIQDYRADKNKEHRFSGGMGNKRYYLGTPEITELIAKENNEWGVLKINFTGDTYSQVRQISGKGSKNFESNLMAEITYLRARILNIQDYGR